MLTTAKVRELKPRASMYEVTCAAMPGFTVRVLPTGKKVFVVRYRVGGKDIRERIGLWGADLSVEEARRQAAPCARRRGRNPRHRSALSRRGRASPRDRVGASGIAAVSSHGARSRRALL